MVTAEEMKKVIENAEKKQNKVSYSVTPEEMQRFKVNDMLPKLISSKKMENDKRHGVLATPGYGLIEEMCLISETSLKKTINGSIRVTRTFLYKFAIGLHMSLEEANKLFELCGGPLRKTDVADYICINYLETNDDIHKFCEQYEKYTGKKLSR
ncbi:hypothetical protein SAMN02910353_00211 [Ruminococcus sp. YRD2003]|uniref:hypothetical protein n=1 Tax=Ruminococcus sp. YRD2003 TaxID=1452313 RepID=UPI0008AB22B4|nr:hypothetical protein SAMN02910353_00211 [Ruminococcus flavefaciens]